ADQDPRYIEHVGSVPPQSMPYWYAAADLNIFPSCGDVWGLVVNEASICGTPTLCSKYAGCSDDLIRDGETGFSIDFSAQDQAAQRLQAVLQRSDLQQVGRTAQQVIRSYTPRRMAHSFKHAIAIGCS
ncbi:MAG: glycosyltransferase, partial [Porticoccaceae bacterium]|nr:glycosyltransferase [Porticoccaceae bacterium]